MGKKAEDADRDFFLFDGFQFLLDSQIILLFLLLQRLFQALSFYLP